MLDLNSAFDTFAVDLGGEPSVDTDFITDFLMPFFGSLPREELAAKVLEIVADEQHKIAEESGRHRTVANRAHHL